VLNFKYQILKNFFMNIFVLLIPLLFVSLPLAFSESSNVGDIYWKQEIISSNSFVDIYVH